MLELDTENSGSKSEKMSYINPLNIMSDLVVAFEKASEGSAKLHL